MSTEFIFRPGVNKNTVDDWNKQAKRERKFQRLLDQLNELDAKDIDGVRYVNYEELLDLLQKKTCG